MNAQQATKQRNTQQATNQLKTQQEQLNTQSQLIKQIEKVRTANNLPPRVKQEAKGVQASLNANCNTLRKEIKNLKAQIAQSRTRNNNAVQTRNNNNAVQTRNNNAVRTRNNNAGQNVTIKSMNKGGNVGTENVSMRNKGKNVLVVKMSMRNKLRNKFPAIFTNAAFSNQNLNELINKMGKNNYNGSVNGEPSWAPNVIKFIRNNRTRKQ
jgi:hypothetical protein